MTYLSEKTAYTKNEILRYTLQNSELKRRLPAPPFLMFDRVVSIQKTGGDFDRGYLIAEKDVIFDEWFFFCHFQGDPVMPGVLEVDALLQLGGFFLMHLGFDGHGRALRTGKTIFREQVRPHHKKITYKINFKKIITRNTPMAVAKAIAEVDGEISAEIDEIMVGMFPDLNYVYP